jgi:hypothetical protein
VLVVEDDGTIASFVAGGLREAGFTVDVAADGASGYEMASGEQYDAAIVDIMLPGLDGWRDFDSRQACPAPAGCESSRVLREILWPPSLLGISISAATCSPPTPFCDHRRNGCRVAFANWHEPMSRYFAGLTIDCQFDGRRQDFIRHGREGL